MAVQLVTMMVAKKDAMLVAMKVTQMVGSMVV